jgi:hypothetical protein
MELAGLLEVDAIDAFATHDLLVTVVDATFAV